MFSYGEFKAEDQVILFVLIVLIVLDVEFCSYRLVLARVDLDPFANVVFFCILLVRSLSYERECS